MIYYEGGILQEDAWYKNGHRDSITTWYDSQGKKVVSNAYSDGKFHGLSITYNPDGSVKIEKNYVMDNLEGPYKEFDEKGTLRVSGNY
ncbi:MAG: hypothetical protein HGA23_10620 [Bacteroidales bacterium]|nr:hypothetical protein [Bacteroidales bacterium]